MASEISQSMVNGLTAALAAKADDADITALDARLDVLEAKNIVFQKAYESAQQVITSAGQLVLAHGLAVAPKTVEAVLVCTTAELGYSVNDVVFMPVGMASGTNSDRGLSVVADATNITLRFGSAAAAFIINNKTTGVSAGATNTSWRLIIRAYA